MELVGDDDGVREEATREASVRTRHLDGYRGHVLAAWNRAERSQHARWSRRASPDAAVRLREVDGRVTVGVRDCAEDGSAVSLRYYMPRKLRELMLELERAGFVNRGGKGSHRNYSHASGIRITVAGQPRDDAKPYQEKDLARALREAEESSK